LRGPIAAEDSLLAEQLAAQVKGYLSDKNTVVYCPLAIGAHVDHVVVRECGHLLKTHGAAVVFYRDFYYDQQLIGEAADLPMICVSVTLTRDESGKKLAAFSEYKSQIADLFGTQAAMTAYFTEPGKGESFFLSQHTDPLLLGMFRSALTRDVTP
jgi:LmbE family N-acetylglucosaminyl deacetylase